MAKHPYHELVAAFDQLPGIGKKAAARLADVCLAQKRLGRLDTDAVGADLHTALTSALTQLELCSCCHYWKVDGYCRQCDAEPISPKLFCIVETIDQANQLLSTALPVQFLVLHGVLSPTSGIGPDQLNIKNVISWLLALPDLDKGLPTSSNDMGTLKSSISADDSNPMSEIGDDLSQSGQKGRVVVTLPDSVEGQITTEFLQRSINKQRDNIECYRQPFDQFLAESLALYSSAL